MNYPLVINILGYTLWVEAGCMLLPMLISVYYGEACWDSFLYAAGLCAAVGLLCVMLRARKRDLQGRDGYISAALAWVVLCLFGALPYVFSGAIPRYLDALFEAASGLTTTGATLLHQVEALPKGLLFWRSLTQWMGGMGVIVLFLALAPQTSGSGSVYLMRAELPGPIKNKLMPRVSDTAKLLYGMYIGLTLLEVVALLLAGMNWFDAVNHAVCTISTGGFSVRNESIAAYQSPLISWIAAIFMFLSGINFAVLFVAVRGRLRDVARSEELRLYVGAIALSTALICANLTMQGGVPFGKALEDAAFESVSFITTAGYTTTDYTTWPVFSQMILVVLMFAGACAGSTAGGIKLSRLLLLGKSLHRELKRILHPKHVSVIRVDGQAVDERVVSSAAAYLVAYLLLLLTGAVVVAWGQNDFAESFTISLSCLSNIGPAMGSIGPAGNFSELTELSKLVMILWMLLGRLELMPLLVLLSPGTWKER